MNGRAALRVLLCAMLAGLSGSMSACKSSAAKSPPAPLAVADGLKVTIDYTVTLADKTVVSSTVGKDPFSFIQGNHDLSPSLEIALTGMIAGETKKIALAAEQAYGHYDEDKRQTVKLAQLPPGTKVGARVRNKNGEIARVTKITEDSAVIDFNDPLAGKDLVYEVTILKVEKP